MQRTDQRCYWGTHKQVEDHQGCEDYETPLQQLLYLASCTDACSQLLIVPIHSSRLCAASSELTWSLRESSKLFIILCKPSTDMVYVSILRSHQEGSISVQLIYCCSCIPSSFLAFLPIRFSIVHKKDIRAPWTMSEVDTPDFEVFFSFISTYWKAMLICSTYLCLKSAHWSFLSRHRSAET